MWGRTRKEVAPSDPTGWRRWRGDGSARSPHSPRGTPCRWCHGALVVCRKTKQVPKQNGFGSLVRLLFILQTESWLRGTYTWASRSVLLCSLPWSQSEKSAGLRLGHAQPLVGNASLESSGCVMLNVARATCFYSSQA